MKAVKYTLFCALLLGSFIKIIAQDTLKFNRFKDIGIYATSDFDNRYSNLNFLKCRLLSPLSSVFDSQKRNSNDSILPPLKYLGLVNDLDLSNKNDDQKINLSYIEDRLIQYLRKNVTPLSIAMIDYYTFKDSTISEGYIDFNNNKFINNCPTSYFPFKKDTLFAATVLNETFDQNQINFLFNDSLILTYIPIDIIQNIAIDFDNGGGFQSVEKDQVLTIDYITGGDKFIKIKVLVNGKIFISNSKISISPQISAFATSNCSTPIKPPDVITNISTSKLGNFVSGKFGVWFSTCNSQNKFRKPFIISAGYNPNDKGIKTISSFYSLADILATGIIKDAIPMEYANDYKTFILIGFTTGNIIDVEIKNNIDYLKQIGHLIELYKYSFKKQADKLVRPQNINCVRLATTNSA